MKISNVAKIATGVLIATVGLTASIAQADVDPAEIYCTIREEGSHLNCQWVGKEVRRSMTPEETAQFIDRAQVAGYISVKSRKGLERAFLVDADSQAFKRLNDTKRSGSISEIAEAKLKLFSEIEKKAIRISDDLDAQTATADLLKFDPSVGLEKDRRDLRRLDAEVVSLKSTVATNSTFQQSGSTETASGTTDSYGSRFQLAIGEGIGLQTVNTDGSLTTNNATVMIKGRFDWSQKWENELDYRGTQPVNAYFGNAVNSQLSPSQIHLGTAYFFGGGNWGLGLDLASDNFISYPATQSSTATLKKFDLYSDIFYGLGVYYRMAWDLNIVRAHLTYEAGGATNNWNGAKPSSDTYFGLTGDYERRIAPHSSVIGRVAYEGYQGLAGKSSIANPTNTNILIGAFYNYSF